MSDDKRERAASIVKDASNALVAAGTGAALAAAAGSSTAIIAATGGAAILPFALMQTIDIARKWKERDAAKWWHSILTHAQNDDATPEEIAGLIEANQEKPFVRETVLRGARAVFEAVDAAVIVPLAMLAREYVREQKAPDSFYRGVSRVLADLSASELNELRHVFDFVLAESKRDEVTLSAREYEQAGRDDWRRIPWRIELLRDEFVGIRSGDSGRYALLEGVSDPSRLFHLLRVNGLGWEGRGVAFDAGPGKIELERKAVSHFRSLLGSE